MQTTNPFVPAPMKWYEVLREALLHPSVETFRRILDDPNRSMMRIYWLLLAYYAVIGVFLIFLFQVAAEQLVPADMEMTAGLMLIILVFWVIIGPVLTLFSYYFAAWILGLVAALFGGTGSTGRLAYVLGVVNVLIALVSLPLSLLTTAMNAAAGPAGSLAGLCTAPISIGVSIYSVFLQVQAVRAEEDLSAGKALLTIIIPGFVLLAFGVACGLLAAIPLIQEAGVLP